MDASAETWRRNAATAGASPDLRGVNPLQVGAERWANGGGWTRTLLAWPEPGRWIVRISVADVERAGPFSVFPGVDRWFAVLEGDGVRLRTAGRTEAVVQVSDADMRAFPGDAATDCELLGGATRDLNFMVRRDDVRATVRRLGDGELRSNAALLGCFVCDAAHVTVARGQAAVQLALSRFSLGWVENSAHETLALQLASPAPRGWWIEANSTGDPPA